MGRRFQAALNWFYYARRDAATLLAYVTLRCFGIEVKYGEVKSGTYASRKPSPLNLEEAKDLDTLLSLSKDLEASADKRRGTVTDKCKTLLTLGSLLLGVVGVLLPKQLAFDSWVMRALSIGAIALLFNAIIILLFFFDIGRDMEVSLDQTDIPLDEANLKKSLLNQHLRCCAETGNRTDYLVDLYRVARFCFLSALTIVAGLVLTSLLINSPADQTQRFVREIRSDSNLISLLRGPKGENGQKGDRGDQGGIGLKGDRGDKGERGSDSSVDDIVKRLLSDPRLKDAIERAVSMKHKNAGKP